MERGSGSSSTKQGYRMAHGLFVGVDDIDGGDPQVAGDVGAANDVNGLSAALAPVLATNTRLLGAEGTRRNLLTHVEDLMDRASSGDLVIAYFGGYGETRYDDVYILPADFRSESFLATALSLRLVAAVLSSKAGVRSLIILDMCGAAAVGFDMSRYRIGAESGIMVSCGPGELSWTWRGPGDDGAMHGAFTHGLIASLRARQKKEGEPWHLFISDWFDEGYEATIANVGSAGQQHPIMLGTLDPNLKLRTRRRSDLRDAKAAASLEQVEA